MRSEWSCAKLGDIADVQSGGTPTVSNKQLWDGDIPWYSSGELNGIFTTDPERTISEVGLNGSNAKLFPAGSLLIGMYDTAALKMSILDRHAAFNQAVAGVKPNDQIDTRFVFYALSSIKDKLLSQRRGVRQKNLSLGKVRDFEIPYPPLVEQRRIVAILDEAFEAIATAKANAEKNLRNARELFNSLLVKVFSEAGEGWSVGNVGTVADCCLGKMLDKTKNKGEPKPYLRNFNVRWFDFDLSDVQEMRFTADEYERYSVRRGDVVICEGGYPGRAAIWENDAPIFIQKALHRVRFKEPILGRWFLYYLYSQEVSGALHQHFTGTGIQHFTGAALARLNLPLAPSTVTATLIERFDKLAEEVARLETIYRDKLASLDELKKSLLHRAFTGQL